MLIHHRSGNAEMKCRRAAILQRLWIELPFDRWRVIDNAQTRATRERPKLARPIGCRRMMQKLGGITFHDSIQIMDAQLVFVDHQSIRWGFAFEERNCSFDSPNSTDQRSDQ